MEEEYKNIGVELEPFRLYLFSFLKEIVRKIKNILSSKGIKYFEF